MATLSEKITERVLNQEVTSDQMINKLTKYLANGNFSEEEIYNAQMLIKQTIKDEMIKQLDKQINNFKFFAQR